MTTLYRPALLVALFALAACSGGAGTTSIPGSQSADQTAARTLLNHGLSATWQSLDSQTVQPQAGSLAAFGFSTKNNNRLLVTANDPSKNPFLGDHHNQTITATVSIAGTSGGAMFTYYGEGTPSDVCRTPASVRLYFTSTGGPFAFTQFWWADVAGSATLASIAAGGPVTLSVKIDPALALWSDWDGQPSAANAAAFNAAASNMTSMGLSFGGGCFFENGVGTSDGSGVFTLQSFSIS